jgi:hypothetical protein
MLSVALILALLPVSPALAQQSASADESTSPPAAAEVTEVEVPERLVRAFDLMKQPGFHPELPGLLGLDPVIETGFAGGGGAGVSTKGWVLIGVGVAAAVIVLLVVFAATYNPLKGLDLRF